MEERDVVADPTAFLNDMVDNERGDGMNGGDLREVKGESAWVGGDGWSKRELEWAWVRKMMNQSLDESGECWNKGQKEREKKYIYIYYLNGRDNKIYYLILAFEL